jgi:hypothetical protein
LGVFNSEAGFVIFQSFYEHGHGHFGLFVFPDGPIVGFFGQHGWIRGVGRNHGVLIHLGFNLLIKDLEGHKYWFDMEKRGFQLERLYGILAILFYVVHGTYWIYKGVPANLLWACHVGTVLVGIGWLLNKSMVNAIGVLWLSLGNIMWAIYLYSTHDFEPSSVLTHVGGIVIGIIGVFRMGIPKYSYLIAVFALGLMQMITRFTTPAVENVNLAFRVQDGWESMFGSYFWYEIMLLACAMLCFFLAETLLRWFREKIIVKKNNRC